MMSKNKIELIPLFKIKCGGTILYKRGKKDLPDTMLGAYLVYTANEVLKKGIKGRVLYPPKGDDVKFTINKRG
jgi:hypothetical protein